MKKNISIQFKAFLLLIVLATNTIIGFACAVGIDMGFNTKHHDDGETTEAPIHVHAAGKIHNHANEANTHKIGYKKSTEKGGCCNDKVIEFQNVDKNLVAKTIVTTPAIVAIITTFIWIDLFDIAKSSLQKDLITRFYPPPKDILISIRKFQV